jgi:hypothetical protein
MAVTVEQSKESFERTFEIRANEITLRRNRLSF